MQFEGFTEPFTVSKHAILLFNCNKCSPLAAWHATARTINRATRDVFTTLPVTFTSCLGSISCFLPVPEYKLGKDIF